MFNILVELTCKGGRVVNAEAYGGGDDAAYLAQRGFTDYVEGAVHPTYRHGNGLTAIAVVSSCARFNAAQELTALIRRIGLAGTDVKASKRSQTGTRRKTVATRTTEPDAYLEGILAKCGK